MEQTHPLGKTAGRLHNSLVLDESRHGTAAGRVNIHLTWHGALERPGVRSRSPLLPSPRPKEGASIEGSKEEKKLILFTSGPGSGMVLAEAVVASNVLIGGGVGVVGVQTAQEAPGFKDFVSFLADSPANPAVLFDADPSNWR